MWVFIFGELAFFAGLFLMFLHSRAENPALFGASQRELDRTNGAGLTVLLLLASFLVVLALDAARRERRPAARRWLLGAMVCGIAFCVLKALEYQAKVSAGLRPDTDDFFTLYYVLTGIHLFHVIIGLFLLGLMARVVRTSESVHRFAYLEGAACYWHMVDMLWIVLFPLLYLAP